MCINDKIGNFIKKKKTFLEVNLNHILVVFFMDYCN